jgi:hydrogenase expression/formation protein HypC
MCLAVPGKILNIAEINEFERMGKVSFGGIIKGINLSYVPEAKVDDYVIVHVGFALSVIDEDEAKKVFEYLKEIDEIDKFNYGEEE